MLPRVSQAGALGLGYPLRDTSSRGSGSLTVRTARLQRTAGSASAGYLCPLDRQAGQVLLPHLESQTLLSTCHTWKVEALDVAASSVCSESKPPCCGPRSPCSGTHDAPPPTGQRSTHCSQHPSAPWHPHYPHSLGIGAWFTPEGHSPEECCTSEESQPPVNWPPCPWGLAAASHLGQFMGPANHLESAIPCPGASWPPKHFTTWL